MTKFGMLAGLTYGFAQDGLALLQGKEVGYVAWATRLITPSPKPVTNLA
jgi:hypothetical protein